MTPQEQGFLLLTSFLGDPGRKPLTVAQLRTLSERVRAREHPENGNRDLAQADLLALGYGAPFADRVLTLLSQKALLRDYIREAESCGCRPITRISEAYPQALRARLGTDAPGCLWAKGDISLLRGNAVALVGNRDLREENLRFAREVGYQAARQGYTLVSGNARGADTAAQEACLAAGGRVISVVADSLKSHPAIQNVLYLSELDWDAPFSPLRALSRNRVLHTMGLFTFVAQCTLNQGGTWDGTVRNLARHWSDVFCMDDGSAAVQELTLLGATPIREAQLSDFSSLRPDNLRIL